MQRTVSHVSRAIAALALFVLAFPRVGAQGVRDSTFLPGVVVTADRVARPLGTTTATVTVITGEQLRSGGIVQLVDALRAVPGVNVVRTGSAGAQTSLFLRGGESDYVRVLVDGVAMNDPGGAIDLSAITVDSHGLATYAVGGPSPCCEPNFHNAPSTRAAGTAPPAPSW